MIKLDPTTINTNDSTHKTEKKENDITNFLNLIHNKTPTPPAEQTISDLFNTNSSNPQQDEFLFGIPLCLN